MRFILFVLIIGLSCSTKKRTENNNTDNAHRKEIEQQIRGFLKWYSKNWDTLNIDLMNPIIENSMLGLPDSTKPYKVNFENSEIYLSQFEQSGYISDHYLNSFRQYFKQCQTEFEQTPQYMGPANGFEFDFIFRSQMYDYEKRNPDKAKVTDISVLGNKATATVKFFEEYYYYYKLSKTSDKWLIDNIKATYEN